MRPLSIRPEPIHAPVAPGSRLAPPAGQPRAPQPRAGSARRPSGAPLPPPATFRSEPSTRAAITAREELRNAVAKMGFRDVLDALMPYARSLHRDRTTGWRIELDPDVLTRQALAPSLGYFASTLRALSTRVGLVGPEPTLEAVQAIYARAPTPKIDRRPDGAVVMPLTVAASLARNRKLSAMADLRRMLGKDIVLEHVGGRDLVAGVPPQKLLPHVARHLPAEAGVVLPSHPKDIPLDHIYRATESMLRERLIDEGGVPEISVRTTAGRELRYDERKARWFEWDPVRRRRVGPAHPPALEDVTFVVPHDQVDELLGKITEESPAAKLELGRELVGFLISRGEPATGAHAELERLATNLAAIKLSGLVYAIRPGNRGDLEAILAEANLRNPKLFGETVARCAAQDPVERVYVGGLGFDGATFLRTPNSAEAVVAHIAPRNGEPLRFFVSIKGTQVDGRDDLDLRADLAIWKQEDTFTDPAHPDPARRIHGGFQGQARALHPELERTFAEVAAAHGLRVEDCEFALTGHSLGAALVELISARLIADGRAVKFALTQAKPAAGNAAYARHVAALVERRAPSDVRLQRVSVIGDPVGDPPAWLRALQGVDPVFDVPGFDERKYPRATALGTPSRLALLAERLARKSGFTQFIEGGLEAHMLGTHQMATRNDLERHLRERYGVQFEKVQPTVLELIRKCDEIIGAPFGHSTASAPISRAPSKRNSRA